MKGYWPTSDHPSARAMNEIPKVVFSRTLTSADSGWPAHIASGDLAEEVGALKAQPGKDLVACAGDEFVQSLIAAGVVDEYRLWVLPAATGRGEPLFPALDEPITLRLLSLKSFPSGILNLALAFPSSQQRGNTG